MREGTLIFAAIAALLLMLLVAAVHFAFPREPEIIIDATPAFARADPQAPMLFAPCPLQPPNFPPRKPTIERT